MKPTTAVHCPDVVTEERRATLKAVFGMLTAALGSVAGPAIARAEDCCGGPPRGHVDKGRFVADFSLRFRTEFETEAMKRPDGDFRPGRAPEWVHRWIDILWDRLIKANSRGPTPR